MRPVSRAAGTVGAVSTWLIVSPRRTARALSCALSERPDAEPAHAAKTVNNSTSSATRIECFVMRVKDEMGYAVATVSSRTAEGRVGISFQYLFTSRGEKIPTGTTCLRDDRKV